ncbi:hypothetical protein ABZ234_31800 [Nocardiopsis sp. NPDC006198]|uniref:hypothetical protein n=1 Tax=Nocardiopsis sp. NPDC006198 TaxID=3154472 RepID=UPI0033BEE3D8
MSDTDPENRLIRALDESTQEYRRTQTLHEEARDGVHAAIVAALKAQTPPAQVTAASPFKSAHVRRVARAHGIPAVTRGSDQAPLGPKASAALKKLATATADYEATRESFEEAQKGSRKAVAEALQADLAATRVARHSPYSETLVRDTADKLGIVLSR